ncbi:RNA polymerase sigma factor [Aliikangiella sp. IMCC44653]
MKTAQQSEMINQLVDQYGKQVYLVAYRILGDASQAEDVAQNVFVKLLKLSPKKIASINHWRAYLCKLASSAAIDLIRARAKEKRQINDHSQTNPHSNSAIEQQLSKNHTPSAALDINRDLEEFRQVLGQLSIQESEVIVLRLIEEFSYQEISHQLNISNSLVGVTLHRAQKKLAELLPESNFLGVIYE